MMNTVRRSKQFALLAILAATPGWLPAAGWPLLTPGQVQSSPLLANLDGDTDGRLEIIVPSSDDKLYIQKHDGTPFTGSPFTLGFGDGTGSSVAVGNVDGTGGSEIVVYGDNADENGANLKVFGASGTLLCSASSGMSGSGRATPCLIDCYKYSSASATHPGLEVLTRDGDGRLHILRWNDSTTLVNLAGTSTFDTVSDSNQKDQFGTLPMTPSVSAVSLANDQTFIVAPSTEKRVYYWTATATQSASPFSISAAAYWQISSTENVRFLSSAALGDIDDNGVIDVAVGANNGNLYVWERGSTGTCLAGWPQGAGEAIVSSPALADLDGDNKLEVIVGSDDGFVYVWTYDGTPFKAPGQEETGWPRMTGGDVIGSPVVAEIDGQPGMEIVASSLDGKLYAWNRDGVELNGWPKSLNTPLYSSPAVADIHNGGRMAVVVAGFNGSIFCFDLSPRYSSGYTGWPQFRGGPLRSGAR